METLSTPRLAALLRHHAPSICDEILDEVCRAIPEYATLIEGPYRDVVHRAVESNVLTFVDRLVAPTKPSPRRDELCRNLGRLQVPFETGLSRLDTAFRVGARVAWRRMIQVFRRHQVPPEAQSALVDLLFGYVDELTVLARDGYLQAIALDTTVVERRRRRLARALLAGRVEPGALAQLAQRASWGLPRQVTVVVCAAGSALDRSALPPGLLFEDSEQPSLVVPGEVDDDLERALIRATGGAPVAIGITAAPEDARTSLRSAAETLRLAESGTIGVAGVMRADDHLLRVWLSSDPVIGERVRRRQLAPFDGLTAGQRRRMLDTLAAWLTHRGDVPQIASDLDLHPQTVRYRMRVLRELVGPALDDPEWRLTTELTLRAG